MIYEYQCKTCGSVHEELRSMQERETAASCRVEGCNGESHCIISTPQIKLEGITGHFPDASDKWARVHRQQAELARKRDNQ
jgi:putative FmdB family regulatory protein